jgi:hypothetical protein
MEPIRQITLQFPLGILSATPNALHNSVSVIAIEVSEFVEQYPARRTSQISLQKNCTMASLLFRLVKA